MRQDLTALVLAHAEVSHHSPQPMAPGRLPGGRRIPARPAAPGCASGCACASLCGPLHAPAGCHRRVRPRSRRRPQARTQPVPLHMPLCSLRSMPATTRTANAVSIADCLVAAVHRASRSLISLASRKQQRVVQPVLRRARSGLAAVLAHGHGQVLDARPATRPGRHCSTIVPGSHGHVGPVAPLLLASCAGTSPGRAMSSANTATGPSSGMLEYHGLDLLVRSGLGPSLA